MGVQVITTCDECGRNISDENTITIELSFEQMNTGIKPDVLHRAIRVLCENHGMNAWAALVAALPRPEESHD